MKVKKVLAMVASSVMLAGVIAGCGDSGSSSATSSATTGNVSSESSGSEKTSSSSKGNTGEADMDSVTIGVLLPLTGDTSAMGVKTKNAIEMFFEDYNENGGIKSMGGAKVNLVVADTTSSSEVAVTEIERLIQQEDVDILIGPYQSAAGAATAPIAEKYGVPYLLTSSCADEIMKNNYNYVFRANVCIDDAGSTIFDFFNSYNDVYGYMPQKYAVVYENTDWGMSCYDMVKRYVEQNGGELVVEEAFTSNNSDFSSIINKVKSSGAEIVFPMCYLNDAVLFTQQMSEYQCDATIVACGGGFTSSDYIANVGELSNYVIAEAGRSLGVLDYKGEEGAAINEKYSSLYGEELDEYSAFGYFNSGILANVLERAASTDADKIVEAFLATDLDSDDPELSLMQYDGVYFADERNDGQTHQNKKCSNVMTHIIDGEYIVIGLVSMVGEPECEFPAPAWAER